MACPSDSSDTATDGPLSPEISQIETQFSPSQPKALHHREVSPSIKNAILGKLSYAPATQTTVVTTTTTTTTSFPPLILKAPRHLHERDPKQYPLAASPTPSVIKRFSLNMAGQLAIYQEADNIESSLVEVSPAPRTPPNSRRSRRLTRCPTQHERTNASLRASNGTISTISSSDPQYQTPSSFATSQFSNDMTASTHVSPQRSSNKRPASPPSITEAAEIASIHRRLKKPRLASLDPDFDHQEGPSHRVKLEDTIPATPETDFGSERKVKHPKSRLRSRRTCTQEDQTEQAAQASLEAYRAARESQYWEPTGLGFVEPLAQGISATPPVAETDLEPAIPYDPVRDDELHPARPAPLDTLSAQDASLPSPSLSPITAAATLHRPSRVSAQIPSQRRLQQTIHEETSNAATTLARPQTTESLQNRRPLSRGRQLELPKDLNTSLINYTNPQLPTPTVMDIPTMLDSFDAMPGELQTYVMYHLLRRCAKPTLHFIADVVNPALKIDFLSLLPLELSMNIIRYLDAKSMCRAAQVSKKWRQIVDSDEKAWKDLLDKDEYALPPGEVERGIREGWGWQFPIGSEGFERDLSKRPGSRSDRAPTSPLSSTGYIGGDVVSGSQLAGQKRKRNTRQSTNKKRKTRSTTSKAPSVDPIGVAESVQGPIAHASAAAAALPDPNIGLPSLRNLHLYKSIYQRHAAIRKSWMDENTKPHHFAFQAHGTHVVTCLQFDSDKILTGSDDTKINVFDTKTGALRSVLDGHEGGVWALQYDGNILVSGSTDRSVRVWDIETGKCLQVFHGHTSTVRCLVILKPTEIGKNPDGTPIIMPKEPLIITGSRDSSLRVWRLPQIGERQVPATATDMENPYFIRVLNGHHHSVRAIAAHGDTLVSGSYDSTVRVWKISTGEMVHRLLGHTLKVYSVVLDHQRNRCISGSMDNLVKVWSLETGQCLFNLEGHTSLVGLLDLSHDRLVSAAADSTLRIWDPENGQCKSTLSAHTGAITCFQHDAQKVISGSDRTLKMWNVKTGECVRDLLTDLSGVWQVKFNERRCVAAVQRNSWTYIEVSIHFFRYFRQLCLTMLTGAGLRSRPRWRAKGEKRPSHFRRPRRERS